MPDRWVSQINRTKDLLGGDGVDDPVIGPLAKTCKVRRLEINLAVFSKLT